MMDMGKYSLIFLSKLGGTELNSMDKNQISVTLQSDIADFFEKWHKLKPSLRDQLSSFFCRWPGRPETQQQKVEEQTKDFYRVFSLSDFFTCFPAATEARERRLYKTNIWGVAGVGSDELKNMGILAWWLRHDAEHGLEGAILRGILDTLSKQDGFEAKPTFELFSSSYRVRRELTAWDSHGRASRMDIIIENNKALIIIEGKINASESVSSEYGVAQLDRYCDLAKILANNRQWAVIYLTPKIRINAERRKKQSGLIELTWKQVANVIKMESKYLPKGEAVRILMESTYRSFSQF